MTSKPRDYDLVIVGGGLSGSRLLIELIELSLSRRTLGRPLNIAVLDSNGAFGGGIPYGAQTTRPGFLLLETVAQSTPPEFRAWLARNPSELARYADLGDNAAAAWVRNNQQRIAAGAFDELFVPRRLFGAFVEQELHASVRRAREQQVAEVTMVKAEALDIVSAGAHGVAPALRVETTEGLTYSGRVVVLAVGCIPRMKHWDLSEADGYVHQPHQDAFGDLSRVILRRARDTAPIDLVILGSGASASEVIHHVAHDPSLLPVVRSVHVVSTRGRLAGSTLGSRRGAGSSSDGNRASARDYAVAAEDLAQSGKLRVRRARIMWVRRLEPERLQVDVFDGSRGHLAADVVVNCMGGCQLDQTSSRLLQNLAAAGRPFEPNPERQGFVLLPRSCEVAAVPGCFVIGPLLNQDPDGHVESIGAVYRVARELAPALHTRLHCGSTSSSGVQHLAPREPGGLDGETPSP